MNSPTLLVGLGGTGSKIVARVSEMIKKDEQRRNISCVIFDTDANDIPEIKKEHPEIYVVQTSARMTVGEYLEEDHYARDNWFPVNPPLDRKVLSEGAGQVRSISRLGFESVIRSGMMDPLKKAIEDLYKVDHKKSEQALRIMIISSLAGGTGSGLIVPVAMYIRQYLEVNHPKDANIARGFFLLPEVFYDAIPSEQRNNLKSNAYASLRELDAFLMKGQKTLSDEYLDSVRLEMPPLDGGSGHVDYDQPPYDFAFLFDAQNAKGEKLNSLEQYMDHAATIVYSMSIGPMNKRSNSSEDNVIRSIAKNKGRNRYAGAGASRLIYPYEDICQVVGMNWAAKAISSQWLEYDRRFEAERRKVLKRREEGYGVKDPERDRMYVEFLEQDARERKPFAASLVESIQSGEDNVSSLDRDYMKALSSHIEDLVRDDTIMSSLAKSASGKLSSVGSDNDPEENKMLLMDAVKELERYQSAARDYAEQGAKTAAYSFFEGAANEGKLDGDYFIEKIIAPKGRYLHPNAIRYLLTKIRNEMEDAVNTADSDLRNEEESWKNFKQNPYGAIDDQLGDQSFAEWEVKSRFGRKKKYQTAFDDLTISMQNQLKNLNDMADNLAKVEIYKKGIEYIEQLISGYEAFYEALGKQIDQLNEKREEIYHKYTQAPGMTVRYVAASRACLDKLSDRYPYMGSLVSVDSDLSRRVSDKVFEYVKMTNKPNTSRYFGTLFEEQILGHYQESANQRLAGELDNGILKAIELEADLMLSEEQKESRNAVDAYIRDVINDTRGLSTPFIERPGEMQATAIDACAYHPSLEPARGDESYEARLVHEELMSKGGSPDEDVDKNEIMFYQSYYGLRANNLSRFTPPRESETYTRNGGEYFNAYSSLIRGIHPNSRLSQEITPHIDRRWHLAAKMPDLDETNQMIEEYGINAAFFWAIVLGLFDFKQESNGQNVYDLNNVRIGLDNGVLLVDEHNRASKIHEVLKALEVQPAYVARIREFAEKNISDENTDIKNVENARIYRLLGNMEVVLDAALNKLTGNGLKEGTGMQVSIFDLPWILKASMPTGTANEKKLLDLFTVMMRESARYISGFCSPEEEAGRLYNFMDDQYDLFGKNLGLLKARGLDGAAGILSDPLMSDVMETAANFLEGRQIYDLADVIRKDADKIKKEYAAGRA